KTSSMQYRKYMVYSFLLILSIEGLKAQNLEEPDGLSLEEFLEMSREQSLESFRSRRQYAQEYWRFCSFRASLLPSLDLDLEPFTYNRSFVERYDAEQNIDVFREQQSLNSFGRLSINQNISMTGASVFVSSSFERLVNYGEGHLQSYNITPIRVGVEQPIMAFNSFKWQKKTASLE